MSNTNRTTLDWSWPERHKRTLSAWLTDTASGWSDKQRDAMARAQRVLEAANGGMVALLGPRGAGKTLIASALAHNALAQRSRYRVAVEKAREACRARGDHRTQIHEPAEPLWFGVTAARYWVLADLLAGERASWSKVRTGWERAGSPPFTPDVSPLEDAHVVDLLVLDEIQERAESEWEDREMTRLLDARYRQCRSTILIGNLKPDEVGTRLGASIVSRLAEGGEIIACAWESFRGKGTTA